MKQKPIDKQFLRFVIPSMLTMLMNGLYTIVDGFFIGHAVGDVGLAGIGLVWPITAVLVALGMGIGVGGSVLMSTYHGKDEPALAHEARANTILTLLAAGLIMTLIFLVVHPFLVGALGATGAVFDAAISYIRIIAIGGSMQIIASGLIPLIRNSHQTIQAMLIMSSGLVCNILLDAYFTMVIPMGLAGAALATICAQTFTVLGCILCLWRQKANRITRAQFKWNARMVGKMLKIGISPFGLSLMPSLITVFNNWQCLAYGGDLAVSAYAVVNYLIASVLLLLEGIGEGMQPLISFCNGARDYTMMKKIRNKGLITILLFSALFLLITIPARTMLPVFFNTSPETSHIITAALPILCIAFPMMGIAKLFSSYFYASGASLSSSLLVYADPIIWTPLCLFVLPRIWGLNGVWMALPGAQIFTMLLLTVLLLSHSMKLKNWETCNATGI